MTAESGGADLVALASGARVWVGVAGQEGTEAGGSGVWITPELVLTCAHVVPGPDPRVIVGWNGGFHPAVIEVRQPATQQAGSLWPYPDLALVRVAAGAALAHPCAWLAEEPEVLGTRVVAFGHSATLNGKLEPVSVAGEIGGFFVFGNGRLWQFTDNEITHGMSGGPVLNRDTGAVCGIVTSTRAANTDRGGFLVPVRGLRDLPDQRSALFRAHDVFHGGDGRWSALRGRVQAAGTRGIVDCPLTPVQETALLSLLARWPDPADPYDLWSAAAQSPRPHDDGLMSLRDVVYALLDCAVPRGGTLSPLLRLTDTLVGAAPDAASGELLRDWTTAVAGRLGEDDALRSWRQRHDTQRARPADRAVIVAIEPGGLNPDLFGTTVWLHRGGTDITRYYCDEAAHLPLEETKVKVCELLRGALREMKGDACVEFVVPVELFNEPFDELVPTKPFTNLGRKWQVVIRDLDRIQEPAIHSGWQERWRRMQADPQPSWRWLTCVDMPTGAKVAAELEQAPDVSMLALSRQPASGPARAALLAAIDAGVPVVVWRRSTCPEHDAGSVTVPCTGTRFRDCFTTAQADHRTLALPEMIRRLRNQASLDDGHECRDVVLLWDNPQRLPEPDAPFATPTQRS